MPQKYKPCKTCSILHQVVLYLEGIIGVEISYFFLSETDLFISIELDDSLI